ncbi:MAG: preprotein translocase subunit SecE [Thermodesulfobacteriota bacterium]
MGRMQKKKPAEQKKKKTAAGDSAPGSMEAGLTGSSGAKNEATAGGQKAGKQKSALSGAAKRTGGDQTALMRLVDRYFGNWIQFLREVKVELSKVAWPSRKQTIGTTAMVIIFVFVIALFLGAVDFGLTSLVRLIL